MSSKNKIREKEKVKRKEKTRIALPCLETRARSEGFMAKAFKAGALNLHWLGAVDLVFVTRVDGWSLASCRCWRLKFIRSPG